MDDEGQSLSGLWGSVGLRQVVAAGVKASGGSGRSGGAGGVMPPGDVW